MYITYHTLYARIRIRRSRRGVYYGGARGAVDAEADFLLERRRGVRECKAGCGAERVALTLPRSECEVAGPSSGPALLLGVLDVLWTLDSPGVT